MKKVILSIAILGAMFTSQAQSGDQAIKFGVRGGLNISNIKAKFDGGSLSTDSKLGFHFGGIAEINVSDNIALQPELLFSGLGAKSSFGGADFKSVINYISIPALIKYKVTGSGFGIYAGPQAGFLISAKDKSDGESVDSKDDYKSLDFSGVIGAEYTLASGLGFGARYQAGIANIAKDAEEGAKVRNNAFQISLHYFFGGN